MQRVEIEKLEKPTVACLTGGGSAAGLDPFVRALVKRLASDGIDCLGVRYGWQGLLSDPPEIDLIDVNDVTDLSLSGNTVLGTSRANPFPPDDILEVTGSKVMNRLRGLGVLGLVVAGGDDTGKVARKLKDRGLPVIYAPKTMDWDLPETDDSVGFSSYVEALFSPSGAPGFINTLKAHRRVGVLEVMGRDSGFTAAAVGLATGACFIAVPELDVDLDQLLPAVEGFYFDNAWALVTCSEAITIEAQDVERYDLHGNALLSGRQVGKALAKIIETNTGIETREMVAGHQYRGMPSAHDAILGFRLGVAAAEAAIGGRWGKMIAIVGDHVEEVGMPEFYRRKITGTWWADAVNLRNAGMA